MGCRHTKLDEREYNDGQNDVYSDLIGKKVRLLFKYHYTKDTGVYDKYELGYYTLQVLNEDGSDYVESISLTNHNYTHMEFIVDGENSDRRTISWKPFVLEGVLEHVKLYKETRYAKGLCWGKWRWYCWNLKVQIDRKCCECISADKPLRHQDKITLSNEYFVNNADYYT